MFRIRRYEFWDPRIFNAPFFAWLAVKCLVNRLNPKTLFKANHALENGDLRASKYRIQKTVGMEKFPATILLPHEAGDQDYHKTLIMDFIREHDFPVIGKPDIGECGKAVKFIKNEADVDRFLSLIESDYLVQEYVDLPLEFGVFYVHYQGKSDIIGVNGKIFPHVKGNGRDSIKAIIEKKPNYSRHWQNFLIDYDINHIPEKGAYIRLSHIGSHTMGCVFTDETRLVTPSLKKRACRLLDDVNGVNFSRMDVRAGDVKSFQNGEFRLIEINGISSLPTQMFDPKYSIFDAYRVFFDAGDRLIRIARENRDQSMKLPGMISLFGQLEKDREVLERTHKKFLQSTASVYKEARTDDGSTALTF